jgi:hypothetical protein
MGTKGRLLRFFWELVIIIYENMPKVYSVVMRMFSDKCFCGDYCAFFFFCCMVNIYSSSVIMLKVLKLGKNFNQLFFCLH